MCGVLRFPRNRGKAEALKAGFAEAAARGFTHAVALDADGSTLRSYSESSLMPRAQIRTR